MIQVKFSKIDKEHVAVLQHELYEFVKYNEMGLNYLSHEEFYTAVMYVDIAMRLFYKMRKKTESYQVTFGFSLPAYEAVIILRCCCWERSERDDYSRHVVRRFKEIIDSQLKSVNRIEN